MTQNLLVKMKSPLKNTEPLKKKKKYKHFWEDPEWKKKEIKKMERNIKASKKRRDESAIRKFEAWEKSGYRTY